MRTLGALHVLACMQALHLGNTERFFASINGTRSKLSYRIEALHLSNAETFFASINGARSLKFDGAPFESETSLN